MTFHDGDYAGHFTTIHGVWSDDESEE